MKNHADTIICMDNLILVNKNNPLSKDYIPLDLEYINLPVDVVDEKKFLRKEAALWLRFLFKAAALDNCNLIAISGFRSYIRQDEIYNASIISKSLEHTENYIAKAGTSEHQTGLSIDLSCPTINNELEESFAHTKEGIWLYNNAYKYGFIIRYPLNYKHITGYNYEPWHIRYIGKQHSIKMHNLNILTLEQYKKVVTKSM